MSLGKTVWMMTTALTVALVPLAAASAEDSVDTETVTVTGYRASLAKAFDLKRNAVGSQDSIVAEDIAAFPDLNLAESMQRIPGVAITRDAGEGRQIVVRGLGPDFTRTQLNGMEVLSNTASGMDNRGNISRTRAFDFSMFASELFNRVTVQKSWSVDQDEGGIAGTVQLNTAKPFDYDGFKAVISAKGMTNTNEVSVTPRIVGMLSDRSGPFGALISAAYSTNDSNEYGYRIWGWSPITVAPSHIGPNVSATDAALLGGTTATQSSPQAITYSTWYTHRERLGLTGAFQYQPSDTFGLDLDVLYGRLSNHRDNYALAAAGSNAISGNVTASGTQVLLSDTIRGDTIVAAKYSGVDLRSERNAMNDTTNFYQTVLNGHYDVTDAFKVKATAGYSRSEYALPVFDKVFMESKNRTVSYDVSDENNPVNTYDFDTTDPSQWGLMRLDAQETGIVSDYVDGKLDFDWALDSASNITFGVSYKKFLNRGWNRNNKVFYNVPTDTAIADSNKGTVPHDTTLNYIVGNPDTVDPLVGFNRDLSALPTTGGTDYAVVEKTLAGYVQYDLHTAVFGLPLRANAGLRYFSTDLLSAGLASGAQVAITHHYNSFLPAANIALDVSDEIVARFSISRNLSRPALTDLAVAGTVSTNSSNQLGGSITAGNPNLKPFLADSIEASLDYYQGKSGYASIGVFYKNMEDMITSENAQVPYGSTGYPLSLLQPTQTANTLFNYSRPVNGHGANIAGIEAAVQKDLDFLPAPFDKFGVTGNVTYIDGHNGVIYNPSTPSQVTKILPLFNLSKFSANVTLYYETDIWGVRVSEAHRSRYLTDGGNVSNQGTGIEPTDNIDFAAHYNLSDNLKLVVEGINLTNQPIIQYADVSAKRLLVNTTSGQTFTFGVTYEF
jgi:iron complex outermembrane recepter protein